MPKHMQKHIQETASSCQDLSDRIQLESGPVLTKPAIFPYTERSKIQRDGLLWGEEKWSEFKLDTKGCYFS